MNKIVFLLKTFAAVLVTVFSFGLVAYAYTNLTISGGADSVTELTFDGDMIPSANNLYDIGSQALAWQNLYVTSTAYFGDSILAARGSATVPTYSYSTDTNTGIYSPGADRLAITVAGANIMSFNPGGVTSTGNFNPLGNSTLDMGDTTHYWKRLHVSDVFLNGMVVFGGYLLTGASTTRTNASGYTSYFDQSFVGREFIMCGSTCTGNEAAGQTLSLIEGSTSTLKITDGSTSGRFGGLAAASSTFAGLTVVSPFVSGTTSSFRYSTRTCEEVVTPTGTVWYITYPNGVATASLTSCHI